MPKTLPERIFFTIVMAAIMVYGMIVYDDQLLDDLLQKAGAGNGN